MQRQRYRNSNRHIRQVEFAFYNEAAIIDAVADARALTLTTELKTTNRIPDPTAAQAIRNMTPVDVVRVKGYDLKFPERWLDVVDLTYTWCVENGCYELARRRYSGEYYRKICSDLHISENVFYLTIDKIRTYAVIQAAQMNLIFVC